MTSIYNQEGRSIACTMIKIGKYTIIQKKEKKKDGYDAIQIGYDEKKIKNTTKPLLGHFKKSNTTPKKKIIEFKLQDKNNLKLELGKSISIKNIFQENEYINVSGRSKGKGFQGVVKRHNFSGVGQKTHGQHNRERAPGSIGGCSYPARVFKGMKMAGRMGNKNTKILKLKLIKIFEEKNIILVNGSVPGTKNSYLILEKRKNENIIS